MKYFVHDGERLGMCDTAEEAKAEAARAIEHWSDIAADDDEWPEEAEHVCWGELRVLGQSVREVHPCDEEDDERGEYWDYHLQDVSDAGKESA